MDQMFSKTFTNKSFKEIRLKDETNFSKMTLADLKHKYSNETKNNSGMPQFKSMEPIMMKSKSSKDD
jgi:hypothetical protein